ncbi:MAG: hypothetical protein Q9220_007222 [cf. Caloplaca sp. 1 TL-2023]
MNDIEDRDRKVAELNNQALQYREALRTLKMHELLMTYGGYMAALRADLRSRTQDAETNRRELHFGQMTWFEVQDNLNEERKQRSKWFFKFPEYRTKEPPSQPTLDALLDASHNLEISSRSALFAIECYTERKNIVCKADSTGLIGTCQWEQLGKHLLYDIQDVPSILGDRHQQNAIKILEGIKRKYFLELTPDSTVITRKAVRLRFQRDLDRITKFERRKEFEDREATRKAGKKEERRAYRKSQQEAGENVRFERETTQREARNGRNDIFNSEGSDGELVLLF